MDICGEHGEDIAYSGRDCPACNQIDEIKSDHSSEISDIESNFDSDMADMQYTIDELQDKINELENK